MPGFVIHIAVGREYIKKHKNEIKDGNQFIKGVVAPDLIRLLNKDITKNETHYGRWGNKQLDIHLDKFLKDKNVDMETDYYKGYFLHLITDIKFYLEYFYQETLEVIKNNDSYYHDYDCLNKTLIEKYHIYDIKDENITRYMSYLEEKPKYIEESKIIKFIDYISNININEEIDVIKKKK